MNSLEVYLEFLKGLKYSGQTVVEYVQQSNLKLEVDEIRNLELLVFHLESTEFFARRLLTNELNQEQKKLN